jgi:uncharacterized protein (DUF2147 family)
MTPTSPVSRALCAVTLLLAMSGPGVRAANDTPVGTWNQYDDKKGDLRSVIRIDQDGQQLTGTIVKAFLRPGEPANPTCEKCPGEFRNQPIEGLRFMWGLQGDGRSWDHGHVLDPEDGKIYRVKLKLAADGRTLEVRGYVGMSLFGRTQRWTRAE